MKTSSVLLHDHTGHDVLERLAKLGELIQTLLDYIGSPLVHFVVLVCVSTDGAFNRLFDDVAHLIHDEGCFFCRLIFVHLEGLSWYWQNGNNTKPNGFSIWRIICDDQRDLATIKYARPSTRSIRAGTPVDLHVPLERKSHYITRTFPELEWETTKRSLAAL